MNCFLKIFKPKLIKFNIIKKMNKNKMLKIRSKYILKLIFQNIKQNQYLELIKYNKNIQNKLDKSLEDYKEYSRIEIDLRPIINYAVDNKFINLNDNEKQYIHIFFNNNKKERKSCILQAKPKIQKIKIKLDYEIKSLKGLFKNCQCLEEINFIKFNRKDIIDMSEMFNGCKNLNKINLLNMNTGKVNNMRYMFCGCSSLKEINLLNFNTANVINMQNMFDGCSKLENLNLLNFNTSNVINMNDMFSECSSLQKLNLLNFNTSNVINMSYMFNKCQAIQELKLSNFDTSKVIDMGYMFYNCQDIKELNLSNFNTTNVINMTNMFGRCRNLKILNISNFDIKNNTRTKNMFSRCRYYLKDKERLSFKNINEDAFDDECGDYFNDSISFVFENDFEFFHEDFQAEQDEINLFQP